MIPNNFCFTKHIVNWEKSFISLYILTTMSDKERMTKGHVIKGYARYIKKKWGNDGVLECQKAIGQEGFNLKDGQWYPEEINQSILHWIYDAHGPEFVEKAAEFTISERGLIAFAAKIAGIEKILERGVEDYYRSFNYGDIKIDIGDGRATVTLTNSTVDEIDCLSWKGALKGILVLVNKKGTVEQFECTFKGSDACKYLMTLDN